MYDLGGGTFDASLVEMEDDTHSVVASAGLADLEKTPGLNAATAKLVYDFFRDAGGG